MMQLLVNGADRVEDFAMHHRIRGAKHTLVK